MLQSIEEIKNAEMLDPTVVNGIDNANLLSIDSTAPIPENAKQVNEEKEIADVGKEKEVEVEEKKEEKVEVKAEDKTKAKAEKPEKKEIDLNINPDDSKPVQKRIGSLTKKWRTAERERDLERERIIELEAKLQEATSKIPDISKPLKTEYDDEDAYIEALTDWKIDVKLKNLQKSGEKKVKEVKEVKEVNETYDGLDDAMDRGNEKYEDFDELVLDKNLVISPEVTQILLDTEIPEDILYHLAANPEMSEKISKLSERQAAIEIGKIEVGLMKGEKKEKEEKPEVKPIKKQSKAPAPIIPVRADGTVEKDPNQMTMKEYKAWRESKK